MRRRLLALLLTAATAFGLCAFAGAASATPGNVGGLDLAGYCQSLGFTDTTLRLDAITGPDYAYNNWGCVAADNSVVAITPTGPAPSMLNACRVQYPGAATYAIPDDPNDAYSWNCYLLPPSASSSPAAEVRAAVTALLSTDAVQNEVLALHTLVASGQVWRAVTQGIAFLRSLPTQELVRDVLGAYGLAGRQFQTTALLGAAMVRAVLNQPPAI